MSKSSGSSSMTNGTGGSAPDPLQRLSSFKTPRDLSLGGSKPNKKVFLPNLNVSRNKNKSGLPTVTRDKRDHERDRRDRKNDRNKNIRNGPNVIKSGGVFSEGLGQTERRSTRASYGRDADTTATLQKPTIRVKDVWKIDKELEQDKIDKVLGDGAYSDEEPMSEGAPMDKDAPVKLPLSDGGWLHSKPKTLKMKPEVLVKMEPGELDAVPPSSDVKPRPEVKKEPFEETDLVSLLRGDKPAMIMLQFPDSLPGRGRSEDDSGPRAKQAAADPHAASTSNPEEVEETPPVDDRCRLADLEEGRIGKLLIHRSGRVRLALGDTMFEVAAGTQASFRQEVVSVAVDEPSRSASLIALGGLPHKLNLLPHWETLLADIKL